MTQATQTIPNGYKQTEIGVIPADWDVKNLGKTAYVTKLAGYEYTNHFNSYKDGGEIIVIRGTNIAHDKLDLSDVKRIPASTSKKLPRSKLSKGDLVFAYVGTIGPVFLIAENDKYHLGPNTCKIVAEDNLTPQYLFTYFKSALIESEIKEQTSVGAQPSLSMTKIRSFKIIVPSNSEEQTAIATALSDTDTLIEKLEKLIDKKKAVKQGAMQQLLTGKKRLPGFSGEWEVKKLGKIADLLKGSGLSKNKITVNGKYECILYGELFTTYSQVINDVKSRTNTKEGLFSINGDILMPGSTTTVGIDLATASSIQKSDVLLGGDIIVIRKKQPEKYDSKFLANYLTHISKYSIAGITQGITIIHLHGSRLKDIDINISSDVKEQTAIATVLFDMDAEIEKLENKLNKYRQIKTGMMQQLLTGKIRLLKN